MGLPAASICDGDQQIVAVRQGEQGNRYIRSFSVVIDADDFTDVIGAAAGGLPGIGAGAVFLAVVQQVDGIPIRVANFGQVAVVKFFYIVLLIRQDEFGAVYLQRQIQAVLIFVGTAFPGDLEIVFAAICVIIDIVFDAGVLGFHRNLPDGFLDG